MTPKLIKQNSKHTDTANDNHQFISNENNYVSVRLMRLFSADLQNTILFNFCQYVKYNSQQMKLTHDKTPLRYIYQFLILFNKLPTKKNLWD